MNVITDRFLALQAESGLSMSAISRKLGIYREKTNAVVRGKSSFTDEQIEKLACVLQTSVDYLTGKSDDPKPVEKQELTVVGKAVRMIPVYNSVSAGFGACAVDYVEEYMPVYDLSEEEAKETIAITVHGDSMSPKIEDGDIIVVHKQDSVESGTVAVVLMDGDAAMVKRVIYDISHIELHSLNPKYSPVVFNDAEVERVRVVGKVTEIRKKL